MRPDSAILKAARLASLMAIAAVLILSMAACGSGGNNNVVNPDTTVSVVIFPGTVTVPVSTAGTPTTVSFTAAVYNSTNTAVTWAAMGGGTFNGSTFTAPTTAGQVTVTATSQADTTKSASVTVTVTGQQALTITPFATAVLAGSVQSFASSVAGVTWSVVAPLGGNPGLIDQNGNFTAPPAPPPGGIVNVVATSANPAAKVSANVSILYSAATLLPNQPYAFSYSGEDTAGFLAAAGSITFDGKGNILAGGEEDVNSGNGISTNTIMGGSYQVGPDGRTIAIVTTSAGSVTWQLTLVSSTHSLLIRFDTDATGSGTLDAQNPVNFSVGSISKSYSFGLSGINANGFPEAIAGNLFANNGSLTPGILDVNDSGTITQSDQSLAGEILTVDSSTGRGQLTLTSTTTGTLAFAFYVVDQTHLKLVESDTVPVMAGDFFSAPSSITLASLAASTTYAFSVGGNVTAGPYGAAGAFTSNGTGGITGGMQDLNSAGSIFSETLTTSGSTYAITPASSNRIFLTLAHGNNIFNYGVYLTSNGSFEMIELDRNVVSASGMGFQQSSGATPLGSYALNLTGVSGDSNGNEEDINGAIAIPGNSTISGFLDINDAGTTVSNLLLSGSTIDSTTTFGRGTLILQSGQPNASTFHMAYYVVNSQTVLLVEIDDQRVLTGTAPLQF
ncbi:MAG: hypothetical protein WB780_18410 [Candidatus Acidiferrales bacterium]